MKRRINLCLYRPGTPRFRILDSYLEVIESLRWGFEALGYDVAFRVNSIDNGALNILFGWIPAFQMGLADQLPKDTILFNMEQFAAGNLRGLQHVERALADFQVWDYSRANIANFAQLAPSKPVYWARTSYAPTLQRIAPAEEDIDLLYIGSLSPRRSEKVQAATGPAQWSLVTLANVWAEQRDAFIGRSRVLLNVSHENPAMNIFEEVRVSYYLANRKAVVCEEVAGQHVEPDMASTLRFAPAGQLADACHALLEDPAARRVYAEEAHAMFVQRDVRDVIRGFFD